MDTLEAPRKWDRVATTKTFPPTTQELLDLLRVTRSEVSMVHHLQGILHSKVVVIPPSNPVVILLSKLVVILLNNLEVILLNNLEVILLSNLEVILLSNLVVILLNRLVVTEGRRALFQVAIQCIRQTTFLLVRADFMQIRDEDCTVCT